jgi:hypothetical protein
LPNSGGGLGLVVLQNSHFQDLYDELFGVLEFVDIVLFTFLQLHNYPSLYESKEGDLCVLIGPLALCNNGRSMQLQNHYPSFKDRHMVTDKELVYESMRKQFFDEDDELPPTNFVFVLFSHFALRIHVTNNLLISAGSQIFVDYGFITPPSGLEHES